MKIDKDLHEIARMALIRLFSDSQELSDKLNSGKVIEQEIAEDFASVADYIIYLELQLKRMQSDNTPKEYLI